MNKQEVFNAVATNLMAQAKRSFCEARRLCMYRAPDGSKCAVGGLIPDNYYIPEIEGSYAAFNPTYTTVPDPEPKAIARARIWSLLGGKETENLLRNLQAVHDDKRNWDERGFTAKGAEVLRLVGSHYELDTSIIDTLEKNRDAQ